LRYLFRRVPSASVASSGQCPDVGVVGNATIGSYGVGRRDESPVPRLGVGRVIGLQAMRARNWVGPSADGRGEARRSCYLWLTLAALVRRGVRVRGVPHGGGRRALRSRLRRCWCSRLPGCRRRIKAAGTRSPPATTTARAHPSVAAAVAVAVRTTAATTTRRPRARAAATAMASEGRAARSMPPRSPSVGAAIVRA